MLANAASAITAVCGCEFSITVERRVVADLISQGSFGRFIDFKPYNSAHWSPLK